MTFSTDESVRGWGCSKCKGDEYEDGDRLRIIRNCDSEQNENIAWDWMPSLRRCPWSQIDEEAWTCVTWWSEFKEFGTLPWGGNDLMEQPNFVLEAIVACTEIKNSLEIEKARKRQSEWQKSNAK